MIYILRSLFVLLHIPIPEFTKHHQLIAIIGHTFMRNTRFR